MLTRDQIRLRRDTDRPGAYFVVVRHNGQIIGEVVRNDDVSDGYFGRWWAAIVVDGHPGPYWWTDYRARAVEYVLARAVVEYIA